MSRLHSRGYRSVSERFPEPGATAHPAAAANPIEETRRKAVEDLGSDHACATRGALNLLIAVVLLVLLVGLVWLAPMLLGPDFSLSHIVGSLLGQGPTTSAIPVGGAPV